MTKYVLSCYDNATDKRMLLSVSVSSIGAWVQKPGDSDKYMLTHRIVGGSEITWERNAGSTICFSVTTDHYQSTYRCAVEDLNMLMSTANKRTPTGTLEDRLS